MRTCSPRILGSSDFPHYCSAGAWPTRGDDHGVELLGEVLDGEEVLEAPLPPDVVDVGGLARHRLLRVVICKHPIMEGLPGSPVHSTEPSLLKYVLSE